MVLSEVASLAVVGELQGARHAVIAAIRRSLDGDAARAICGDCAIPDDAAATAAKRRFAAMFDPYVIEAYGGPLDPATF